MKVTAHECDGRYYIAVEDVKKVLESNRDRFRRLREMVNKMCRDFEKSNEVEDETM